MELHVDWPLPKALVVLGIAVAALPQVGAPSVLLRLGLTLVVVGVWAWFYLELARTEVPRGMRVHHSAGPRRDPKSEFKFGYLLPLVADASFPGTLRIYCSAPVLETRAEIEVAGQRWKVGSGPRANNYGVNVTPGPLNRRAVLRVYIYSDQRVRPLWVTYRPANRVQGKRRWRLWRR